jgi:hypothetical protein
MSLRGSTAPESRRSRGGGQTAAYWTFLTGVEGGERTLAKLASPHALQAGCMDEEGALEEVVGDCVLSEFISDQMALPSATLEDLSGDGSLADAGLFPSGLVRRVAKAWTTPLNRLTCAQARVLVGQQFGLQWLAAPVAVFLSGHPRAECDLYPGDLMCVALRAHAELLRFAPVQTRALLGADFSGMAEEFAFDPDGTVLREATDDLATARKLGRV